MSAMSSPLDLGRHVDEASELAQVDCKGCGAPMSADITACAYCGRQTPYGARRARLDRLGGASLNYGGGNWQNPSLNDLAGGWSSPISEGDDHIRLTKTVLKIG